MVTPATTPLPAAGAAPPAPAPAPAAPPARRGVSAFFEGFAAPREGFAYMCRYPALWRYAVIPVLLNVLITAVVFAALVAAAVWYAAHIHPRFAGGWHWRALEVFVAAALLAAAAGLAMAAWVLLNGILCGHYHAKLARQVELQLGLPPEQIRDVPFSYQVVDAFRDLGALLAINAGFLLLNIVPVLGSAVGLIGSLYFDCYVFGRDYLDFPLALRGVRRDEKRRFCREYKGQTVGVGAAVLLCNFVPVVGAVVLSTAAAGAVLLHRRLRGSRPSRRHDRGAAMNLGITPAY